MKLRLYSAITTGALAMILVATMLWSLTEASLGTIFFAMIAADAIAIYAVMEITTPKKKRTKWRDLFRLIFTNKDDCPIYNLDREEWGNGRKAG